MNGCTSSLLFFIFYIYIFFSTKDTTVLHPNPWSGKLAAAAWCLHSAASHTHTTHATAGRPWVDKYIAVKTPSWQSHSTLSEKVVCRGAPALLLTQRASPCVGSPHLHKCCCVWQQWEGGCSFCRWWWRVRASPLPPAMPLCLLTGHCPFSAQLQVLCSQTGKHN